MYAIRSYYDYQKIMGETLVTDDREFLAQATFHPIIDVTVTSERSLSGATLQFGKGLGIGETAESGKDGAGKVPVATTALGNPCGVRQSFGAMGKVFRQLLGCEQKIRRCGDIALLQPRQFGVQGDSPDHPMQFDILLVEKHRPTGGNRGQAQFTGLV